MTCRHHELHKYLIELGYGPTLNMGPITVYEDDVGNLIHVYCDQDVVRESMLDEVLGEVCKTQQDFDIFRKTI